MTNSSFMTSPCPTLECFGKFRSSAISNEQQQMVRLCYPPATRMKCKCRVFYMLITWLAAQRSPDWNNTTLADRENCGIVGFPLPISAKMKEGRLIRGTSIVLSNGDRCPVRRNKGRPSSRLQFSTTVMSTAAGMKARFSIRLLKQKQKQSKETISVLFL